MVLERAEPKAPLHSRQNIYSNQTMDCAKKETLEIVGESVLSEFDKRIKQIPEDLCAAFNAEAGRFEEGVLTLYRMVAICVRDEDDLDKVASCWALMVRVCDKALRRINSLAKAHPYSGSEYYYDRLLDLRNKCRRLQKMHS